MGLAQSSAWKAIIFLCKHNIYCFREVPYLYFKIYVSIYHFFYPISRSNPTEHSAVISNTINKLGLYHILSNYCKYILQKIGKCDSVYRHLVFPVKTLFSYKRCVGVVPFVMQNNVQRTYLLINVRIFVLVNRSCQTWSWLITCHFCLWEYICINIIWWRNEEKDVYVCKNIT